MIKSEDVAYSSHCSNKVENSQSISAPCLRPTGNTTQAVESEPGMPEGEGSLSVFLGDPWRVSLKKGKLGDLPAGPVVKTSNAGGMGSNPWLGN